MGKIKKILENELVGGTHTTDVYPVTSVKAVYDENNERLDHILNRRGVVNISTNYNDDHIAEVLTLPQALSKVPNADRVIGFQGKYLASDGWHTIIYTGDSLTSWSDKTKWIDLADKVFNSISNNATFAGIATPATNPGTPDGPVFYFASAAGTYSNFGGIQIADGEAVILEWKDGWVKKVTGLSTNKKLFELVNKICSICGYDKIQPISINENRATIGSNGYFPANTFTAGEKIKFCLIADENIVDKYAVVTGDGVNIDYNVDYYRFSPNTIYEVTVKKEAAINTLGMGCYVNAENAKGNGQCLFVVSTKYTHAIPSVSVLEEKMAKEEKITDIIGFDLVQNLVITKGSPTYGGNTTFSPNTLEKNVPIYFCLLATNNCVEKYAFVGANGIEVAGSSTSEGPYRYVPNKIYTFIPGSNFIDSGVSYGCYVNSTNAIGDGNATFIISKDENNLLTTISQCQPKADYFDLIGFDLIQRIYVIKDSPTNSNYFKENTFTAGQRVAFCLIDKVAAVNKYCVISSEGDDIENNTQYYRFEPNKIYFATVSSRFANKKTSCYVNRTNAIGDGNVIFYITTDIRNILQVIEENQERINSIIKKSLFQNKKFAVLGDSLSETGVWERRFSELTGAIYINGYEKGGTPTLGVSGNCGMDRALKLYAEHPDIDFIFIQNINDGNYGIDADGDLLDIPYMMTKNVLSSKVYGTVEDAVNALSLEISSLTPLVGTMIRLQYGTSAKKLTISNSPTSNGNIIINIGDKEYGVYVSKDMTTEEVQANILAYDFSSSGYNDTASGTDAVLFADNLNRGSDSPIISVDTGETGVVASISDATTVNYISRCFVSKSISNWNNTNYWVHTSSIKRYSQYKGLVNWLQTKFPRAMIFFLGLPRHSWSDSTPKYDDGTYNQDAYRSSVGWDWLFDCQRKVSEYLGIPYLNVKDECGISIFNASTFYPKSNVHPYTLGYERWGEAIARIIK